MAWMPAYPAAVIRRRMPVCSPSNGVAIHCSHDRLCERPFRTS